MKYKIYGSSQKSKKGKAVTFGYKLFETKSKKKFIRYLNTHATIPCAVEKGHRLTKNVAQIFDWIRLDVDGKGEAKKIDKCLKKLQYFKKPSTSNDGTHNAYKWHYFIPIKNVSQSYDAYKLQYHNFLSEFKINIQDVSLSSVVQNTNPRGEDGIERTIYHKGEVWVAPSLKVPKRKKLKEKHSEIKKNVVKDKLKTLNADMNYAEWLKVGMALYDWCPKKGFKLFNKWSKKSDKYDVNVVEDKWNDFSKSLNGDVTIGSLLTMGEDGKHVEKVDPTSMFKVDGLSMDEVLKKQKKEDRKKKKKRKKELKNFNPLYTGMGLTEELIKKRQNQKILFPSVLVERMHTFLYGASGTNKTTVVGWIMGEVLEKHKEKVLHFWSFDASQDHESSIFNYIKTKPNIGGRYQLISNKTPDDFYSYYNKVLESKQTLNDAIIVIDTFKFISKNVNDKNANKNALHFIKKLQTIGATILTIGHTNKDGIKQSGTAEIEQDTDAILRIDRNVDEMTKSVTLTISKAGRSRFACEGVTFVNHPQGSNYKYLYTALTTMKVHKEVIDLASISNQKQEVIEKEKSIKLKKAEQELFDKPLIKVIQEIITSLKNDKYNKPIKQKIVQFAKIEESIGKDKVDRLLREYEGKYWKYKPHHHGNGGRPTKLYKVIKNEA